MKSIRNENTELLMRSVLKLETVEECYSFFDDLCTISEIKSMAQRMEVAKMLNDRCVYTDIAEKTGASTATISRVNKCLNYGSDGYSLVLKRLEGDAE